MFCILLPPGRSREVEASMPGRDQCPYADWERPPFAWWPTRTRYANRIEYDRKGKTLSLKVCCSRVRRIFSQHYQLLCFLKCAALCTMFGGTTWTKVVRQSGVGSTSLRVTAKNSQRRNIIIPYYYRGGYKHSTYLHGAYNIFEIHTLSSVCVCVCVCVCVGCVVCT